MAICQVTTQIVIPSIKVYSSISKRQVQLVVTQIEIDNLYVLQTLLKTRK